jgi:hypothetical protein
MRTNAQQPLNRTQRRLLDAWRRVQPDRWLANDYDPDGYGDDLRPVIETLNAEAREKLSRNAA